jgi:DNA repair protein RecO (recombination protein O)
VKHFTSDCGVVLRLRAYSEFDSIITLFTEKSGKKIFLVRGVRRLKSKNSGTLQPFSVVSFDYIAPRKEGSFSCILDVRLLSPPPKTNASLFFLSEISERFSREEQISIGFLNLLFEVSRVRKFTVLPTLFLLKTLTIFGVIPVYGFCSQTEIKLSDGGYWMSSGEMVAHNKGKNEVFLTFSEIKILRFWQRYSLKDGQNVSPNPHSLRKILSFLLLFLEKHHDIKLKTKDFVFPNILF